MKPWTPDRTEKLRELWSEGHTASQIGNVLGVSRNSVIGVVHRRGWQRRLDPHCNSTGRVEQVRRVRRERYAAARPAKVRKEKPAPEPAPIPVEPLHIPFLERQVGQCRAITDATRNAQRVCGHLIEGDGAFCRWHRAIYYVPADPKKKPRAR
jgi:hypothetical protein